MVGVAACVVGGSVGVLLMFLAAGYKYLKIHDGKDHMYWRCPAKVTTHETTVQSCRGEHTWVNGQYRISQCNYYDCHGPRTNNHVEGWNSRLKKIVWKFHPNIFEIIDVMRKEQATMEMCPARINPGSASIYSVWPANSWETVHSQSLRWWHYSLLLLQGSSGGEVCIGKLTWRQ